MKTKGKLFFSTLVLLLCTGLITRVNASGPDLQKTYSWKYTVNKDGSVSLDNYDCDLTIHTWDKGETEFHLTIDAKTRSDEDAARLDNFLQNLKFSNSAASVSFRDSFWETRNNIMGRMTMKLESGKQVALTGFSMRAELWIPAGCRFSLGSKYSEVNMEDFSGGLFLNLYNDNFYGGNVTGRTDLEDKYSTIEFKEMKDLKADLYNSKLQSTNVGDLNIESKYSRFVTGNSGNLDIDSYNDKYTFTSSGDITLTAKYTDLRSGNAGKVSLDCYEGSVNLKEVKDVRITSKYADFQFDKADNVTIESTYNDKLAAGKLISLKIGESKYCSYRIDELVNSVTETDGYEDKFNISKTGQDFKGLSIAGKYVDIVLTLPTTVDFRFRAKINYPKLDIDEARLTTKTKIKENSGIEYDAVRGTEKEGMPLIEVNGYEMGLKIVGM